MVWLCSDALLNSSPFAEISSSVDFNLSRWACFASWVLLRLWSFTCDSFCFVQLVRTSTISSNSDQRLQSWHNLVCASMQRAKNSSQAFFWSSNSFNKLGCPDMFVCSRTVWSCLWQVSISWSPSTLWCNKFSIIASFASAPSFSNVVSSMMTAASADNVLSQSRVFSRAWR